MGLPSMLNSVVIRGRISLTSAYLICHSSGLGWTVIPSAPNFSQFMADRVTSGILPPLAFLMVAILFMLTLSLVISQSFICFRRQKYIIKFNFKEYYAIFEAVYTPQIYEDSSLFGKEGARR